MKWKYENQDMKSWPDWIIGANYAHSKRSGVILIHRLELCHLIFPGDTVQRGPTGDLIITPGA